MTRTTRFALAGILALETLSPRASSAYPAYRRFLKEAVARPSCLACHVDEGRTERNAFGEAWQKAGEDQRALRAIESADADGDGTANLAELRGGSNPGDGESRPGAPGAAWSAAREVSVPADELKLALPGARRIEAADAALTPDEASAIEARVGRPLTEEERAPTFFVGHRGRRRVATALFVYLERPEGRFVLLVGITTAGKVHRVFLFRTGDEEAAPPYLGFLKCLAGARRDAVPARGRRCPVDSRREATFQAMAGAVRVALEAVQVVQARTP